LEAAVFVVAILGDIIAARKEGPADEPAPAILFASTAEQAARYKLRWL
jgi:hypothetical protein